jgi:hypothetical protein
MDTCCGKVFGGSAAIGKGQSEHNICAAANGRPGAVVGIGDRHLSPLGQLLAHDADDSIRPTVATSARYLICMSAVKRIVFADDGNGSHGGLLL